MTDFQLRPMGIPDNTIYGWVRAAKSGQLNIGTGYRTPEDDLNLAEKNAHLRKQLKAQEKEQNKEKMAGISIPSERTVYRVMEEIGIVHHPKRKHNGITKADRKA